MFFFSTFFEEIAKFSKKNSFNFNFSKNGCIKMELDKKSTILDVFAKITLKIRQSKKLLAT